MALDGCRYNEDDESFSDRQSQPAEVVTRKRADSWYARLFNLRLARAHTTTEDEDLSDYFDISHYSGGGKGHLMTTTGHPFTSASSATSSCSHRPAVGDMDSTSLFFAKEDDEEEDDILGCEMVSTQAELPSTDGLQQIVLHQHHFQQTEPLAERTQTNPWMTISVASTGPNREMVPMPPPPADLSVTSRKRNSDFSGIATMVGKDRCATDITSPKSSPRCSPLFSPRTKRAPNAAATLFSNYDTSSQSDEEEESLRNRNNNNKGGVLPSSQLGSPKTTTNAKSIALSPAHLSGIGHSASWIN